MFANHGYQNRRRRAAEAEAKALRERERVLAHTEPDCGGQALAAAKQSAVEPSPAELRRPPYPGAPWGVR